MTGKTLLYHVGIVKEKETMQKQLLHAHLKIHHVVAFVDVPDGTDDMQAMEYAYRWTNNVMGSWSRKEKVF